MATSLFFMATDQNSGEIRTEAVQKSRGRKPGSKTSQQNQIKKPRLRGMGVAQLERIRVEEEKKKMIGGGDTSSSDATRLPEPEPVVVLQGFPSYAGPPAKVNRRFYCGGGGGGVGSGHQIMIDPVWGFVETSTELSSIPNLHHHPCDTCFKKKRFDGDNSVVRSNNSSGFTKYTIPPPMMMNYDHLLPPDNQRSYGVFYNDTHSIARSDAASACFSDATGSVEEFGGYMEGINPRNGSGGVKEYEFFPGKYDNFPGNFGKRASSLVGDSSPINTSSTIDLSLKL